MGGSGEQARAGFHLLGRLFPATPLESLTSEPFPQLVEKYKRRDARANLLGLAAFAVSTLVIASVLAGLARLAQRGLPVDTRHVLGSGWLDFVLWAMFASLFLATYLSLRILRLALGRREFAIYMAYGARRLPGHLDVNKAFFWLSVVFVPPIIVLAALYVTSYTAFTDRTLIDRPIGSRGTVSSRAYAEIRGIYLVRGYHARLQDHEAPFFVIGFNDGSRWETRPGHQGDQLKAEAELMDFVSNASGKPISHVHFREEIPQ